MFGLSIELVTEFHWPDSSADVSFVRANQGIDPSPKWRPKIQIS